MATCSQRTPCARCPWRRDADPAYWHPENFTRVLASAAETGVMLCHKSPSDLSALPEVEKSPLSGTLEEPAICAGFALVVGYDAIGMRLWSMRTKQRIDDTFDAAGIDLYDDAAEMMDAVREANS